MKPLVRALLAGTVVASLSIQTAHSQEASPATPASSWSASINWVSQYRFAGIDQNWGHPALQGSVDWSGGGRWYAGIGASEVSPRTFPGGRVEVDLYAGYNGKINADWGYTFGVYAFVYPGADLRHAACPSASYGTPCAALPSQRYDTTEVDAGLSWKWLSYKLWMSTSDYFGANRSTGYDGGTRGSLYHDLTATWPLRDGFSLSAHVGYNDVRARYGSLNPDFMDWKLMLAKSWSGGWNASVSVVGATNDRFYRPPIGGLSAIDGATRNLDRPTPIVQVGKTF